MSYLCHSKDLRSKYGSEYLLNPIYNRNTQKYNADAETFVQGQNQILVKYPPFPLKTPQHFAIEPPVYKSLCPLFVSQESPRSLVAREISIDRFSSESYPCARAPPGSFVSAAGTASRITSKDQYKSSDHCRH